MEKSRTTKTRKKAEEPKKPTVRFRRQFDPDYKGSEGSLGDPKVITVPDQTIPLETLLKQHTRGIPMEVQMRKGLYGYEVPNVTDINDLMEMRQELNDRLDEINTTIARETEAKEKKDTILPDVHGRNRNDDMESNQELVKEKS